MLDAEPTNDAAARLRLAISALQADDLEQAALLLADVQSCVQAFVDPISVDDPRLLQLQELWSQASAEASMCNARLHERLQQQTASQRAVRAYG